MATRLVLKGWGKYAKAIASGKFSKRLRRHVRQATGRNALDVRSAMLSEIKGAKLTKNAALTIAIKGENLPLRDHGDLLGAITTRAMAWNRAFAGVLRKAKEFNVAKRLHDGGIQAVSARMRGLFFVLWKASMAKREGTEMPKLTGRAAELFERFQNWFPLQSDTRAIKTPARPFAENAMADAALRARLLRRWYDAARRALTEP